MTFQRYCPFLVFFSLAFLLSACDILGNNDPLNIAGKEDIYRGIYSQGIEDSNFNPCLAQNESWQFVEINDTAFVQKILKVHENPFYMEIKGTPSHKGEFKGFYATFDRQITIEEVVQVGSLEEQDCS